MHRWGNKKDMAGDDPPYLTVGTEVSAKYKGAFCEAKIRKVVKTVKCKVQYKNEQGSILINEEQIKGVIMPGASVEVKQPEKKEAIEGTIVKIQDLSQYTVVFDDGDIATLRRTALCLKSGRHFAESETLDQLPLTHPEHFSTPVVSGVRGSRRRDDMDDISDDEDKREPKIEREEDMGKVVCVEIGDKKKTKDNWFPGLVVAPNAQDSVKIDVEDEYLVRSFKDGRYYTVPKSEATEFTREIGGKVDNPSLKQAVEKAISFLDKSDLPPHWDRDQLFGVSDLPSDIDASDTDSTDDEPREEKDHFVAQLYKFMDDRGTPINKGPIISSKDVDMYKLFKLVYKLGGYNRVTNRNQWRSVTVKLGYSANQLNNVKTSYKKFLHSFEDFYRKLGCTLLTTSRDNKLRSRSSRPLIRDRDKAPPEKLVETEENTSSNSDDNSEIKVQNNAKEKGENESKYEVSDDEKRLESKKDTSKSKNKRDRSTDSIKDEDKLFKKKLDIPLLKDFGLVQSVNIKENKDDKSSNEKRIERKTVKSIYKAGDLGEKKNDRISLKMKTKRLKRVEKKINKSEVTSPQMRPKRTLKDRMKAIVQKLKLNKNITNNESEKKTRVTSDDLHKMSQFGVKVKTKDELSTNGSKTRKLSLGSNDGKCTTNVVLNYDKKAATLSSATSNIAEPSAAATTANANTNASTSANYALVKIKKSDEDFAESNKKKSIARKRKDEEKFISGSNEPLINQVIEFVPHFKSICIGDRLKVYYEPTHESKVTYEAKVTNKRDGTATEYLVHYTGWNNRYDEWIRRSRIADNLSWSPTRAKKKSNQTESPPGNQVSTNQYEQSQSTQQNQNSSKMPNDRIKRSSPSPVPKNRGKNLIKTSINKQMKNMKNKFESKPKKAPSRKDVDSSSESESDAQKKQQLQKTRSRTVKQKQGEDTLSAKESGSKKKTTPLKRTRSGSIKLECNEPTKKRKFPVTKLEKNNKSGTIRNSLKSLVSRNKRVSNRIRDSFKDEKSASDKTSDDSNIVNDEMSDKEAEDDDEMKCDEMKMVDHEECVKNISNEKDEKWGEVDELILKIKPLNAENIAELELIGDVNEMKTDVNKLEDHDVVSKINEDDSPPVLKKEIPVSEEMNVVRSSPSPLLAGSYLSENLENKPKIIKTKAKKDFEDKNSSPSKIFSRSPSEKSVTKLNNDIKEKSFFLSRSPGEKKLETIDKERKDIKLRNVSTWSSYLNMDKIESIKKTNTIVEKNFTEKPTLVRKSGGDSNSLKGEDDIYEFKEPEPFEFRMIEERAIAHRRQTTRIFEDGNYKRPKLTTSTTDIVISDTDESNRISEEMNINETKSILDTLTQPSDNSCKLKKTNLEDELRTDNEPCADSIHEQTATTSEESTKVDPSCDSLEFVNVEPQQVEQRLSSSDIELSFDDDKHVLILPISPALGISSGEEVEPEAEDDAEEPKLVILENEVPVGNVTSFEFSNKEHFEKVNEIFATATERLKERNEIEADINYLSTVEKSVCCESPTEAIDAKTCSVQFKFIKKPLTPIDSDDSTDYVSENDLNDKCIETKNITNEPVFSIDTAPTELDSIIASDNSNKSIVKASTDVNEIDNDIGEDFKHASVKSGIAEKSVVAEAESSASTSSFFFQTSSAIKHKIVFDDDLELNVVDQNRSCPESDSSSELIPHHSIIDEVEIEICESKKDVVGLTETVSEKDTESEKSDHDGDLSKSKDDEEEVINDGLLCEETIPKSPESKDMLNDVDIPYSNAAAISINNSTENVTCKEPAKPKTKSRPASYTGSINATYKTTSPSTPEESNSTPGTSPSEEISGFSSTMFSLNEKSCLNKDSSENETCSDYSEKSMKVKKYLENENYNKKNSLDYESYLKKKNEKDSVYKLDEPVKKKSKCYNSNSTNGSEKDCFSDGGNSPKVITTSPPKSSVTALLAEIPQEYDSNQRIEFLEQKLLEIKKKYNAFKQEVAAIDRKRKKLRRKEREGRMMTRNEANSLL